MWYMQPQRLRPACAYAQSDQNLCESLEYSMSVKLLIEQHLELPSLKDGCTGSLSLFNMSKCHNVENHSHVMAQMAPTLYVRFRSTPFQCDSIDR